MQSKKKVFNWKNKNKNKKNKIKKKDFLFLLFYLHAIQYTQYNTRNTIHAI